MDVDSKPGKNFMRVRLALLSALTVLLVVPAAASAMTYVCVGSSDPRCVGNYSMTKAGLNTAAQVADFQIAHWGPTTILIGPGDLNIDYDFFDSNIAVGSVIDFSQSTALTDGVLPEDLHIVGAGRDQTTITATNVPCCGLYKMLKFDTASWSDSSISDLTIQNTGAITNETALEMFGGTIDNVRFVAGGGTESMHTALYANGSQKLVVKNSYFDIRGLMIRAITASAPLDISDSTIASTLFQFEEQYGIDAVNNLDARRLKVIGLTRGIRASGDTTHIDDSVVRLPRVGTPASFPGGTAYGVEILATPADGESSDARLRGLTVYGDQQNQVGVSVFNSPPDSRTSHVSFGLDDSIISLTGADTTEFTCGGSATATVTATIFYSTLSLVPFGSASTPGCTKSTTSARDRVSSPPQFVDPANDDFHPLATSPTIDDGSDDSDRTPPKLDLDRNARFVDGNGDGSAIIDMGAFEFQPVPGAPPAGGGGGGGGGGTTTPTALSIKFGKAVGKFKVKSKAKTFKLTGKRTKPRLPITSSAKVKIKLTLKKGKKKLKGSQSLTIPAGNSYVTFSGKWNKKKLKPGKYTLFLTAPGLKDSPKSVLSLIR